MSTPALLHKQSSSNATFARIGLVAAALLIVALLVIDQSRAAFSATTTNSGNTFTTATIDLTDDDADSAMFAVPAMVPGDVATGCLTVTYTGTADPNAVKIYANAYTESDGAADGASLDDALTLEIDRVDDCTGLNVQAVVDAGTSISAFATAHTDYSDGLSAQWDPAATSSESYLFTATFTPSGSNATDNTRIGDTVSNLIFTWETQVGS